MATGGRHSQPGSASYLEDLLSHLSEQLCHFTQARMEMADLYEKMHALASQKSIASEELVAPLEAVLHKYSSKWVETRCKGVNGSACDLSPPSGDQQAAASKASGLVAGCHKVASRVE